MTVQELYEVIVGHDKGKEVMVGVFGETGKHTTMSAMDNGKDITIIAQQQDTIEEFKGFSVAPVSGGAEITITTKRRSVIMTVGQRDLILFQKALFDACVHTDTSTVYNTDLF